MPLRGRQTYLKERTRLLRLDMIYESSEAFEDTGPNAVSFLYKSWLRFWR